MIFRHLAAAAAFLALMTAAEPALGQTTGKDGPSKNKPAKASKVALPGPGETPSMSAGHIEQTSPGEYLLTGEVDFRYGSAHLLADNIRYSESERKVVAEGNVVIELGGSEVSGDRVEVHLDSEYAVIEKARAYIEPDLIVDAERMERVAEESFRVTDATLTSCTQPTPYWSFHVRSAIIHVGHYAHLRSATLRIGRLPVFWSPYLAVPVKEDRAAGLLFPHFGFTRKRGPFLSNAVYVPIGQSVDATLQIDSYNGAVSGEVEQLPQTGFGLETRFVPSATGSGTLTAYLLPERFRPDSSSDAVSRDRYHVRLNDTHRLPGGFKLLMDVDVVSDLNYFIDFEREVRYSSTPTVFSQFDLSRQAGPYAVNVRLNRQDQFLNLVDPETLKIDDLLLYRLPEVELRGRGIRLGQSRFYLSYLSSIDGLVRKLRTFDANGFLRTDQATYNRLDFFPTISGSFTPVPWLDISPVLAFRETYYTSSDKDPGPALDPSGSAVNRQQYRLGVSVVGPRLYRLYGSDEEGKTRYKNTFEPRVTYDYVPEVAGGDKIIPFDEIDSPLPTNNLVTYSITSRLFAKKPPKPARAAGAPPALMGSFASLVLGEEAPTHNQELVSPSPAPGFAGAPASSPTPSPPPAATAPVATEGAAPGSGTDEGATPATPRGGETYVPSEVSTGASYRAPLSGPLAGPVHLANVGPVEIASFELAQGYSLDPLRPLTQSSALDANSHFTPVVATVRFNPTYSASLDLRTSYDILFHDIDRISVSGGLKTLKSSYVRLSWVLDRDLEGVPAGVTPSCSLDGGRLVGRQGPNEQRCFTNSSQIHVVGGTALFGRKITADVEGSYDIENSFLRDQRYRVGYNTQCCGVLFEVSKRALPAGTIPSSDIQYRFVLNLRGVGTFLDLNGRQQ